MDYIAQHWLSAALLLMPLLMIAALVGNAWLILRACNIDAMDAHSWDSRSAPSIDAAGCLGVRL